MDTIDKLEKVFSELSKDEQNWLSARFALYFWPALKTEQEFTDKELMSLFLMMNASVLAFIHPHLQGKAQKLIEASTFSLMDGVSYRDAAAAGSMFSMWGNMVFWVVPRCADDESSTPRLMPNSSPWQDIFNLELELVRTASLESLLQRARSLGEIPSLKPNLGGAEHFLLDAQRKLVEHFYSRKMGLFAQQIEGWFDGKLDVLAMMKCLQLDKKIIDSGSTDVQCQLILDCTSAPPATFNTEQRARFTLITGDELPTEEHHISANQKILLLEQALSQAQSANTTDDTDVKRLRRELEEAQSLLEKTENALSKRIETATEALKSSQSSVDSQIKRNRLVSMLLEFSSAILIIAGAAWWGYGQYTMPICQPTGDKNSIVATYLHHFFPLVLAIVVSTILLRHDAKILSNLIDLVRQKQTIEQFTGLFKASQYARRDIDESMKLAESTFDEISKALITRTLGEPHRKDVGEVEGKSELLDLLNTLRKTLPTN
jgi:hypothetical protein